MLNLILADSALEIVPAQIFNHPSFKKIRKTGKNPHDILLDRTFHHFAMVAHKLKDDYKRGRPDIIHISLLNALATPLYKNDYLNVFVHTYDNNVILIGKDVRIPKSYSRFEGLILNLFNNKKIVTEEGELLLEFISNVSFGELIEKFVKPDMVIGFSVTGTRKKLDTVVKELDVNKNPCFVIGGFPKGYFSKNIDSYFDKKYSIFDTGLESHVLISRLIYEYEKNILL